MRSVASLPSRAISCAPAPAERTIWPPLPGLSSTLCRVVPSGILRSGRALPGFTGASSPAVGVQHQGDTRRAVGVVLDRLHLARDGVLVALEVDHSVAALVATPAEA